MKGDLRRFDSGEEPDEAIRLVVKYYGIEYEIIEFSSIIKFDSLMEKICRKCKKVIKGDYIQIADRVLDICSADRDWMPTSELDKKVMHSPVVLKRLNELLRGRDKDEFLSKFSRSGICDDCLNEIDKYLGNIR